MGMSQPAIDNSRASLIWALWHNIDPAVLQACTEEKADTISVQSYEVAYKHTPRNAFPSRRSQYAQVLRVKTQQNAVRAQYSSTAPVLRESAQEKISVQAKPTTFYDARATKYKLYKSDTFLTDVPEYLTSSQPDADSQTKICMPAFLPTIQAKTQSKQPDKSQTSSVRKYLSRNEFMSQPYTTPSSSSENTVACVSVARKSVLPREVNKTVMSVVKPKKRKTTKHKTKYKHTGNKRKKVGKLYFGKSRELSTSKDGNATSSSSSHSYHTFVTPQDELVRHFSRISMRQVQATLNNTKLALPSLN